MTASHETNTPAESREALRTSRIEGVRHAVIGPLGLFTAYGIVTAVVVTVLGVNAERDRSQNGLYWLLPAMVLAGLFIPYTITSLAHLIMARSLGFRIDHFAIGPIQLFKDTHFEPRLRNQWPTFSSYRFASRGIGNGWKQNVAIYLFAGWLSTAIPLWIFTPQWNNLMQQVDAGQFDIRWATTGESIYAFCIFFATLGSWFWALAYTVGGLIIPMRDLIQDRERISHHLTHLDPPKKPEARSSGTRASSTLSRTYAVNQQAPEQSDIRPRDWNAGEILALADDWTIQPPDIMMLLRAYYHVLDSGDSAVAGSYLVRAVTAARSTTAVVHPRLLPEAAYYFARHRGDIGTAGMHLEKAPPHPRTAHVRLRARAALELASGRSQDAVQSAQEALDLLDHHSPPGIAAAEREWLERICAEAASLTGSR